MPRDYTFFHLPFNVPSQSESFLFSILAPFLQVFASEKSVVIKNLHLHPDQGWTCTEPRSFGVCCRVDAGPCKPRCSPSELTVQPGCKYCGFAPLWCGGRSREHVLQYVFANFVLTRGFLSCTVHALNCITFSSSMWMQRRPPLLCFYIISCFGQSNMACIEKLNIDEPSSMAIVHMPKILSLHRNRNGSTTTEKNNIYRTLMWTIIRIISIFDGHVCYNYHDSPPKKS